MIPKYTVRESYYKRSRPDESPMKNSVEVRWYTQKPSRSNKLSKPKKVWLPQVKMTVKKDPILKKYPKIEKEGMKHELREMKAIWKYRHLNKTERGDKAHKEAKAKNPSWLSPAINKMREEQKNPNWRKSRWG